MRIFSGSIAASMETMSTRASATWLAYTKFDAKLGTRSLEAAHIVADKDKRLRHPTTARSTVVRCRPRSDAAGIAPIPEQDLNLRPSGYERDRNRLIRVRFLGFVGWTVPTPTVLQEVRLMRFEDVYGRLQRRRLSCEAAAEVLGVLVSRFYRYRQRFEAGGREGCTTGGWARCRGGVRRRTRS